MPDASIRFQLIVPCYNPPPGWDAALARRFAELQAALAGAGASVGLIVVDDGSTREVDTAQFRQLAKQISDFQFVQYFPNRGKGHALRQGVALSDAPFVLLTDIDFPYTVASICRVAENLIKNGGIAAGNRSTAYYAEVPLLRRLLSRCLRWLLRHVLRQPIDDSQCGLKGFDQAGKAVFLKTTINRFLYDLEFLMLAEGRVAVTPVPVELRSGVAFNPVGWKILAAEGGNFIRLFLRQLFNRPARPARPERPG